jgi:hypothetical protein
LLPCFFPATTAETAPAPTGFAELVSEDFPVIHFQRLRTFIADARLRTEAPESHRQRRAGLAEKKWVVPFWRLLMLVAAHPGDLSLP